jgi:hypothetical protein
MANSDSRCHLIQKHLASNGNDTESSHAMLCHLISVSKLVLSFERGRCFHFSIQLVEAFIKAALNGIVLGILVVSSVNAVLVRAVYRIYDARIASALLPRL